MPEHIYLIAGEASGDFLGAQLMRALKGRQPDIKFSGIGGDLMQAEGLHSLFSMRELSLMGIAEILPKIPKLLKRIHETAADIESKKPDMVVTIDAPDFSFRVHKKLRKNMSTPPKLVHYVAPTVWAWRSGRAKNIAKFLDALICLFDFEPPYFEAEGLSAIAVGHPMIESGILEAKPAHIGGQERIKIGFFPGSRQGEFKRTAPVLLEAIKKIRQVKNNIMVVVPTLPHLREQVESMVKDIGVPVYVSTDRAEKWSVFKSCDFALAVSGTVGLELAVAGVPHLIAYKAQPLTAAVIKRLIKVPYAHLGNLILKRAVIPEFLQDNCTADKISHAALSFLNDEMQMAIQKSAFEEIRLKMGSDIPPSKKAAEYLLSLL